MLLVEDDGNTRAAMQWALEHAGAAVFAASTGAEALARIDALDARGEVGLVVVSDLGLPVMSGYELVEQAATRARAAGRSPPPALAVSAHARDVDRRRAFDAGFDLYLAKPVTPAQLIEAVVDLRDIGARASEG